MSWRDHLRAGVPELNALRLFDYNGTPNLARMDCNESALPPTPEEMDAFAEAARTCAIHRYPDVSGAPLRDALARRWSVEPNQILLGNGSVETLSMLVTAFGPTASGKPAKVLYPDPSFPYYEVVARTHGAVPLPVALDARFQIDEANCAEVIERERPALAIFASPNNPSGSRFDADILERLARRMAAVFVVDEAYADFDGRTMLGRVGRTSDLFVMRSLSKIGLAGLRIGALVGARDAIAELDKVRLPWNVSAIAIAIACAALRRPELLERRIRTLVDLRDSLASRLREIEGIVVYPSDANFLLVRVPGDATETFRALLQSGVLVKDVSRPGLLERCLRITVGTSAENERCQVALLAAMKSQSLISRKKT